MSSTSIRSNRERFALLLGQFRQLLEHTVAPPTLRPFAGIEEASAVLTELARAGSDTAQVNAALGNVLVRERRYLDAVEAYRSATAVDPGFAQAHLAASELAYILSDIETSTEHRAKALRLQRVYADPLPVGNRRPVLLVLRDAAYAMNAPLELLLDRNHFAVHKYYVEGDAELDLPDFACAFTAFGYAPGIAATRAAAFLERTRAPYLNEPRRICGLAREALAQTLGGIDGVIVVPAERVSADALGAGEGIRLVRPADTHAGDGLALVDRAETLAEHVARFPSDAYHVSPFFDYRSADGYYRKYRIIFVDGVAYPYHLAIAPRWMVHYQSAPMREREWMRDEELAFLAAPHDALPRWDDAMPAIARAAGLDYFGIDLGVLPDGRLLIFEADSAMLVHDEEPDDIFAAKRPYVGRIRDALANAIEARIEKDGSSARRKSAP